MTPPPLDPLRTGEYVPDPASSTVVRTPSPAGTTAVQEPGPLPAVAAIVAATRTVAGYVIERELGRGGMGVVYLARHVKLDRPAALKMVLGEARADSSELIRFLAEAGAVAAVRHPHVVGVYDYGESDGRPFLALEYCPGGTLKKRLKDKRLETHEAATLVRKIAEGVAAAHAQGIVHRDLKPDNVLFDESGEPRVNDFGLAKRPGQELTRPGMVMGTLAYMSPEQAKGESKFVGPQADVWALGVILYECLAGARPFVCDTESELRSYIINADPDPLRKAVPEVPRDLELICLKCLEKIPHERYATAQGLADDLGHYLAGRPVSVRPLSRPARTWKWMKRNPVPTALMASLVVLLGVTALAGYSEYQRVRAENEKVTAESETSNERIKRFDEERAKQLGAVQSSIRVALRRGAASEAIAEFEKAEAAGLVTIDMRLDKARAYSILCQPDRALAELARVEPKDWPPEALGPARLLEGSLRLGGWTAVDGPALALIEEALTLPLPEADRRYALGLRSPMPREALTEFEAAIAADPAHVDARAMAILALVALGRLDDAVRLGEQSRPFAPNHPYFTTLLASTWAVRGNEMKLNSYLDEIRPAFSTSSQFNDLQDALRMLAKVRGNAKRATSPLDQWRLMSEMGTWVKTMLKVASGFQSGQSDVIPMRFPPFFRNGMKFLIDELVAVWETPETGMANPLAVKLLKQMLPGYQRGPVVFQFTDAAGVEAARKKLATHPEGTLKTLFATQLAVLADRMDDQSKASEASRRMLAAAGAAFEEASRAPGLLKHTEEDLEEAYKCYWVAGLPHSGRTPHKQWLITARDLLRERLRLTPPLRTAEQFDDAAHVALWAQDWALARLLLDDWDQAKLAQTPSYFKLRAWADYGIRAYGPALNWLDKLTPQQLAADQQASDIREACLRALNPEPAPPPRRSMR